MEIKERNIADLKGAEYNPRKLSDRQQIQLASSLTRYGLVEPIIVNVHPKRKDILVGGHQRMRVWSEMGNKTIPTVEVSLTLAKEKELNVRLNKNTGAFDMELLEEHFKNDDLIEWGFEELDFMDVELTEEPAGETGIPGNFDDEGIADSNQYGVIVMCSNAGNQEQIFNELRASGYECKVVVT